jgi:hypothetical protein
VRTFFIFPAIVGICFSFAQAAEEGSSAPEPSAKLRPSSLTNAREKLEPFLQDYCIDCHGSRTQKGQVRFDDIKWEINDLDTAQRWQDVLDQLNGGDMPPEDETQPLSEELSATLDVLTGAVLEAQKRLTDHGGEIKMRRLNRREYSATIEHLFGFPVALVDIPEDGEIASFDTVGAEQFFNSSHFERYLDLGRKIATESFRYNYSPRREVTTVRTEPEERVTKKTREKLADLDRKMALKQQGADWKKMGFKDEGEAEIIFRQWDSRAELPRNYLEYPHVERGVYISDLAKWANASKHVDIRGEYVFRIHGGIVGEPDELRKIVRLWDQNQILGTLKLAGTPEKPESIEFRARQPMGRSHFSINVRENAPLNTQNTLRGYISKVDGRGDHTEPRAAVFIDWLEIEGPYYPEKRPRLEEIVYPGVPTGSRSPYIWDDAKVPELIEKFATEAFRRRSPEPEYLAGLNDLFASYRAEGMNHRDAWAEITAIILSSPGFLFIQEEEKKTEEKRPRLDNRELAIRLSYFLWSSPPDDELYNADLSDPAVFDAQVDRLLADPQARRFRDGFVSQWAELDRYDAVTVDNKEHFRFNEGVREDAKKEVREFFGHLIEKNLPAANLIDSDFAVINSALAVHYDLDIPHPKNADFVTVDLPAESPRGGLMTQTAFLTTGSNGERSSPVIRGALVMEKLLHDEPAPPPPNVPELGSDDNQPRTNREMVQIHQEQAVCASCHKKMDIIGFGLENFDTIGRWRETEKVGNKQVPIEPGGTLPDGAAFANVQELKKVLLDHEEDLARELVESMMTYALGRTIEFSDADDVDAVMEKLRDDKFRVGSMVREVARSEVFGRK